MNEHTTPKRALFIVGKKSLTNPDQKIKDRLESLGYEVEVDESPKADASEIITQDLAVIIISESVNDSAVNNEFRDVLVPVVVLKSSLFKELCLTGRSDVNQYGHEPDQSDVFITNPKHPMAAELGGIVKLGDEPVTVAWGEPAKGAAKIASLTREVNKVVLFGYDEGQGMVGLNAPARRVGLFFDRKLTNQMETDYWRLFDAAVEWAAGDRPRTFADVYRGEWAEIQTRRQACSPTKLPDSSAPLTHPPGNLVGLALSGGGIRAATFSLGLLQGMRELGLLRIFDYLSTVSGGGYLGGWWSAWLQRKPDEGNEGHGGFPPHERIEPDIYQHRGKNAESQNGTGESVATEEAKKTAATEEAKKTVVNEELMENVLSAGTDPIHHLRLFANYLTPRKGALSSDTWRVVTVVTRNLILTWAILLPLLVVAILLGKLYFALQPYAYDPSSANAFLVNDPSADVLGARFMLAAWPLIGLAAGIVVLTCVWTLFNRDGGETRRDGYAGIIGTVVVIILTALVGLIIYDNYRHYLERTGKELIFYWRWILLWLVGLILLLVYTILPVAKDYIRDRSRSATQWQREVLRTRIVRSHSFLLVTLVVVAFVLLLAGFGHELVNYLFRPSGDFRNAFLAFVAKSGGWIVLVATIAGAIFTAFKTSPAGGSDPREIKAPSLFSRAVFKLTPPLVVLMLAITASWVVNWLLIYLNSHYAHSLSEGVSALMSDSSASHNIQILTMAMYLGIVFSFFLILVELKLKRGWPYSLLSTVWVVLALMAVFALISVGVITLMRAPFDENAASVLSFTDWNWYFGWLPAWLLLLIPGLGGALLCFRLAGNEKRELRSVLWPIIFALVWAVLIVATALELRSLYNPLNIDPTLSMPQWMMIFIFSGLTFCLVLTIFELFMGRSANKRPLWLLGSICLTLTALFFLELLVSYTLQLTSPESNPYLGIPVVNAFLKRPLADTYLRVLFAEAIFMLISASLAWVVAMGWMADPNALSMHAFYKARLVRAYLGASNKYRSEQRKGITEAVEGDDVLLQDLQNCKRGAPYHLINTTLNLVGGRDLTTAQRLAASFVLSKRYCGSSRTGYRDTREYMGGQFSLGTAVAISGAAASPNMGAKTLTASLTMLMTFLNVRLGYWAPTPNKQDWRSPKARLWPFYMMREFLSQTHDLSTYCYLTDGGHFDNTGLYSLVERGCRFIVAADCGADPRPCFQDVGDAIRRCRIDFGAEFDLDITPLMKDEKEDSVKQHFAVGTILYSRMHARALKWDLIPAHELKSEEKAKQDIASRTAVIILFKPALTNKDESADVRQYRLENLNFPQQKTLDQWYDEAQFESYRQLGKLCAELAFDELPTVKKFKAMSNGGTFTWSNVGEIFQEARLKFDPKARHPSEQINGDRMLVSRGGWWDMRFVPGKTS
ncbi:MAG: hypothetical protein QOH25_2728 [Acidobacteriota bacterium]|nr:hypothetical protein [Acidobacteriota bacterium]